MSPHVDLSAPLEQDSRAPHANDDARTAVRKAVDRIGGVASAEEIQRQLSRIGRSRIDHADILTGLVAGGECFATPAGWTTSKELADAAGKPGETPPAARADLRLVTASPATLERPSAAGDAAPPGDLPGDRGGDVERYLRERGHCSQRSVVVDTGLSRHAVVKALNDLEAAGVARRTGENARDWPGAPPAGRGSPVWEIRGAEASTGEAAASALRPPESTVRRARARDVPAVSAATATANSDDGDQLVKALHDLGVRAHITGCFVGPHITRWELALAGGSALRRVRGLAEELAYALAVTEVRVIAPIPGKRAIGIEIPNTTRSLVYLRDIAAARPAGQSPLSVWLGRDVTGAAVNVDLAAMPHVLVAGTTGAGKSGGLHAMISSILMGASPDEARLVLVDTKRVEFNRYEDIAHLLRPVVFDDFDAVDALSDLVAIMEDRYRQMGQAHARSLSELNATRLAAGESALPHILCVVDEFADLMALSQGAVEHDVVRLAQKARAIGIHLVLATQTPRVTVITGVIKANIPARIAFAVASGLDSRVILDMNGAQSLLGAGDMLFRSIGSSHPLRIQGSYIEGDEIDALTRPLRQKPPDEDARPQGDSDEDPSEEDEGCPPATAAAWEPLVEAVDPEPATGNHPAPDVVTGEALDERRPAGHLHTLSPTRPPLAEVGEPVRAVLERASTDLHGALAGWELLADSAEAVLIGRYAAALLKAIERGDRDPGLLDRFERLLGI